MIFLFIYFKFWLVTAIRFHLTREQASEFVKIGLSRIVWNFVISLTSLCRESKSDITNIECRCLTWLHSPLWLSSVTQKTCELWRLEKIPLIESKGIDSMNALLMRVNYKWVHVTQKVIFITNLMLKLSARCEKTVQIQCLLSYDQHMECETR